MKAILALTAGLTLSATASSQVLSEDFSSGVPPTGWTTIDLAGAGAFGWVNDIWTPQLRAMHDYDFLLPADTLLVTPVMDLSASTNTILSFLSETEWVDFMAHHPFALSDGVSTVEISLDGGATWTVIWTDDVLVDLTPVTRFVDLSAYDGMSNVQLAFRYFGLDAHTWWVDDVVVDNDGTPVYAITGLVAGGFATFQVIGATPGGTVLIGYSSAGAGPTATPFGAVDMSAPIRQFPTLVADPTGTADFSVNIPPGAVGVTLYTQGVDLGSGILTNSLAETVL
ncbi:MAG: choice-of-anchor J domain-containing protein [Planctomycetota bacterium]|jgi:hypothetical protein